MIHKVLQMFLKNFLGKKFEFFLIKIYFMLFFKFFLN